MSPSVRKIAQLAGVSVGSVSRVINGATNVDVAIREKTILAMRKLNYIPDHKGSGNSPHRENARQKTWNIGIVYCGSADFFAGNQFVNYSVANIEKYCRRAGYHTLVEFFQPDKDALPQCIKENRVDGVLCTDLDQLSDTIFAITAATPLVGMFNYAPLLPIPQICVDDYGSGTMAVWEAFTRGHRNIAFVNFKLDHFAFTTRRRAYGDFMKKHKLFRSEYLLEKDVITMDNPANDAPPDMGWFAARIAELNPRPTAVIVANDWGAAGLYKSLAGLGIKVGRDISLIGFDNFAGSTSFLEPGLATVAIPFDKITEDAAEHLLNWVDTGAKKTCTKMVPGTFIARPSLLNIAD